MPNNLLIYAALQLRRKDGQSMKTSDAENLMSMLPAERRAVGVIALIGVLRMFGLFALLPVLALHAATLEGATPLLIGMAVGSYGLTQAGLQIPLGALSDRIGRVPVIVGGLAVFAAGSVLAAYSESIHGVIAGRLLQGAGAISATLTALIADATRDGVRTRSMAVFGIGVGTAFLLAMVFGPLFSAQFGVPALFLFAAVLAGVAAALLFALGQAGVAEGEGNALEVDDLVLDLDGEVGVLPETGLLEALQDAPARRRRVADHDGPRVDARASARWAPPESVLRPRVPEKAPLFADTLAPRLRAGAW